ncbi:MAG: hypothetical protein MMC23_006351 [Stictis urceolatum]|nr:hypothetical protein [Stictis urceolata]
MAPLGNIKLDPKTRDIRVVHVFPSVRGLPIRCRVSKCSLDAPEPYTALSHTWGDADLVSTVTVVNEDHTESEARIMKNLAEALQTLRDGISEKAMWIDAICIDQANSEEKDHQVRQMRWIFRKARAVLAWIGMASSTPRRALEDIKHIAATKGNESTFMTRGDPKAIAELSMRPWFSRVWVRQELYMAPIGACSVHCGDDYVETEALKAFISKLAGSIFTLRDTAQLTRWKDILCSGHFISLADSIHTNGYLGLPMNYLLWTTRDLQATDPRDHVLGLLALTEKPTEFDHLIDYSKDVAEVFTDLAVFYLQKYRDLSLWSIGVARQNVDLNLPSWVPDWTPSSGSRPRSWHYGYYKACSDSKVQFSLSQCRRMLTCQGCQFARVDQVERSFDPDDDTLHEWKSLAMNALSKELYEQEPASIEEAFARTILAGMSHGMFVASSQSSQARWPKSERGQAYRIWAEIDAHASQVRNETDDADTSATSFGRSFTVSTGRCFVVSTNGHLALAPSCVMPGDSICVLQGGHMPVLLREDDTGCYQWVGLAYAHGIMDGEAIGSGKASMQFFSIK